VQTGLAGKVVIVTAATANIGRGIALAFAAEGARVVIVGRDAAAGQLVAKLARE
jgi:NAD(P)-dependent dehydrogenase (short-subunit alcohol dehydrogenase family)